LLGWKCKAGRSREAAQGPAESGRWAAPFIVGWLLSQTLLPIRHYFIPGDARITHEGLSFSWRLKTDEHHASAVQFFVKDMKIISHENSDPPRINWNEWHGDRTIYRTVVPGRIHWSQLPEILVLFEPIIGERVIYNPAATADRVRTEAESRERAARLWQELYGRQPRAMRRTIPLFQALDSVAESLQTGGKVTEAAQLTAFVSRARQLEQNAPGSPEAGQLRADARKVLDGLYHRGEGGGMRSLMRSLDPFALEEGQRPVPFLVVEDPEVCDASSSEPVRVNRAAWKDGPFTRGKRVPSVENLGGEPLIVYLGNVGAEAREMLPSACVFDSEDYPERFAYIWWNTLKDVTNSKLNHISNQPFYLVRYARRVAGLWEKEYQRRPVVNAITAVSLNRRPYQLIVDPEADLASVPITWLGHNVWIRDLETQRIPREVLLNN